MAEGQEKELAQLDNATREKLHKIEEARQKTIAAYATKGQEPNPDELAKLDETKAKNEEEAAELARADHQYAQNMPGRKKSFGET